tara:strand:- start:321 stop:1277 length:957 start_codon:yes stop_codon:yes gene_type:complete
MKLPDVVAMILGGLFIGFPVIKFYLIGEYTGIILTLGDVGLMSLMFLAGLESSWDVMLSQRKPAAIIAIFASLIPFILGFVVFMALGFSYITSLIVGICLSVTAEATKSRVLIQLNRIKTKVGAAMMGAGIVDDIAAMALFITVTFVFGRGFSSSNILLEGALFSFFLGIIVQKNHKHRKKKTRRKKVPGFVDYLKIMLTWVLVPFFYVSMGINFDIVSVTTYPVVFIIILAVAIVGKIMGTMLAKPFTNFTMEQHYLIGWGMNSRGAVEMALAIIAFKSGFIPLEIYSGLIAMALFTTMMFPIVINGMVKFNPRIMS